MKDVAAEAMKGLHSQPMLLAVICLNIVMLGAGAWFLSRLAEAQQARWDQMFKACMTKVGEL